MLGFVFFQNLFAYLGTLEGPEFCYSSFKEHPKTLQMDVIFKHNFNHLRLTKP